MFTYGPREPYVEPYEKSAVGGGTSKPKGYLESLPRPRKESRGAAAKKNKVACIPSPRVQKQQEVRYNQVLEGIPRSHILDFFCGGAAEEKNTLRPTHTWTTPNARRSRGGKLNTRPDPYMHHIHVKQRPRLETKTKEAPQGLPRGAPKARQEDAGGDTSSQSAGASRRVQLDKGPDGHTLTSTAGGPKPRKR